MNILTERRLNGFSLGVMLISAHYGLGFIQGTAEQAFLVGNAGCLYAVSLGLGTVAIVLLGLARFYWEQVEQIWTLLGNRYGRQAKVWIGLMAWSSLIGIEAAQILAGAFILKVLGLPLLFSMVVLTIVFVLMSLLPVEQASYVFQALLTFNLLTMFYSLWTLHGLGNYLAGPIDFIPALGQVNGGTVVGIFLSTLLLLFIDMECQQFLVQAKDISSLRWGCSIGAAGLISLAFLPSSVVMTAQNAGILPLGIDGKATIPYILLWVGGGADHLLGIVLLLSLLVPALGVGSSVLRVQNKTFLDFDILPNSGSGTGKALIAVMNGCLGLTVAWQGSSIIDLIVAFNAVYVAAALIPFFAYLLAHKEIYLFTANSVRLSLAVGSVAALTALILTLIRPETALFDSPELSIMLVGLSVSSLGLILGQLIEKYILVDKITEKI